jgi:hypothetical protein
MTVTFNNFYINENKLEGTSTWKREMIGTELICIQNTLQRNDMDFNRGDLH